MVSPNREVVELEIDPTSVSNLPLSPPPHTFRMLGNVPLGLFRKQENQYEEIGWVEYRFQILPWRTDTLHLDPQSPHNSQSQCIPAYLYQGMRSWVGCYWKLTNQLIWCTQWRTRAILHTTRNNSYSCCLTSTIAPWHICTFPCHTYLWT